MSDLNEKIHEIDQYLLGVLDAAKVKEVEGLINKDDDYADLVRERKNLKEGIEAKGRQLIKDKIKAIHETRTANEGTKEGKSGGSSSRFLKILFGIVAVALLIYIGVQGYQDAKSVEEPQPVENLYASYFEPFEVSEIKRSGTTNAEELNAAIQIENLYNQNKYQQVIPLLESKLDASSNKSSTDLIALGISYMETGNLNGALKIFDEVLASGDFNFENDAQWYKALTYLKQGDSEKAKQALQPLISDKDSDYHTEAQSLHNEL